jgi:hypothetical protein
MTQYDGIVRIKNLIRDPTSVEPPGEYMGYLVEVVSPTHRKGEIIRLALGPDESRFKPKYDIGDELSLVLP